MGSIRELVKPEQTKVPSGRRISSTPIKTRIFTASRTVLRETPNRSDSSISVGMRLPGVYSRRMMAPVR